MMQPFDPSRFLRTTAARGSRFRWTTALPLFVLLPGIGWIVAAGPADAAGKGARSAPASTAVVIPIQGEINTVMVGMVRNRIERAVEAGIGTIVFDMDTPGGTVTDSIAIADMIRELTDVRTIAWVNPNAHSGGAIVALACSEVVMTRSSRLGNAQVVLGVPLGVDAVPEDLRPKAYSPVLAEFRASANLRGYDPLLCEALVVPDREVWWIENVTTGARQFVTRADKDRLVGGERTIFDPKPADDAPVVREWKLVESYHDPVLERQVTVTQPIVRSDQNLEMTAGEAVAFGFARGVVSSEAELKARFGLTSLVRFGVTWSESLAVWLTSIYVRGFLLVLVLLGIYVEFHTPGVGLPGLVALIALAIFVAAPYVTGLANVWEIIVIFLGLALIAVEIFVLPGFGIAGIAGIVLVLVGILGTFIPNEPGRIFPLHLPTMERGQEALKLGIITVSSSLAASVFGMFVLSRFLPKVPVFNRLIPPNPTPSDVQVDDPYRGAAHVGDVGEAVGPLRPAGKACFGGMMVDVVTQGDFIESGAAVEVVERRGNRIVVRARV